jgi:hypothetical protein
MSIDTISLTRGAKVPTAIYTSSAEPVCIVDSMAERKDDSEVARRIVACWNACKGMSIAALESMPGHYFGAAMQSRQLLAEKQRDELLAAIDAALDSYGLEEGMQAETVLLHARDKVLGD